MPILPPNHLNNPIRNEPPHFYLIKINQFSQFILLKITKEQSVKMHFVVVVVTAVLLSMFSTSTFVHCGGGDVSSDSSEYHSPEAEDPSERRPVESSTATPSTSGGGANDCGQRKSSFKAFAESVQKARNNVVNGASRGVRVVSTGVGKHVVPTVTTAAGKVAGTVMPTVTTAAGKVAGTVMPTVTTAAGKVAGTAQRGATEVRNAVEPNVKKSVWAAREKAAKPVYNNVVVPVAQFISTHAGRVTEWPLEKEPEQGKAKKEEGKAKKEEGKAKKEEGKAKKEEGKAKKEEGKAKKEEGKAKKEEE